MTEHDRRALATDPGRSYAERLAALDALPPEPELLALRGDILRFLGRIDESEAVFRSLPDPAGRIGLANARCARADWAGARAILGELHGLDPRTEARVQAIVASTWFNQDDLVEAGAALERAVAIQRSVRDREGEAISVTSLGIVAFAAGESSRAFAYLDEGRDLSRRVGLPHWEAMARSYLAMLRHDAGDLDAAEALYDESIEALDRIGVRRAEGITLLGRAMLRIERGRLDAAVDDLRDALSEERATSPDYEPLIAAALAIPASARGDLAARDHQLRFARECLRGSRFASVIDGLQAALEGGTRLDGGIEARLLGRAVAAVARGRRLRVAEDSSWFELDGQRVDLSRRKPLRRILAALVERHRGDRGASSVDALVRAGWPDEKLVGSTGATRLYTAVATLRKMGLEGVIERSGEGYAIADGVVVDG